MENPRSVRQGLNKSLKKRLVENTNSLQDQGIVRRQAAARDGDAHALLLRGTFSKATELRCHLFGAWKKHLLRRKPLETMG